MKRMLPIGLVLIAFQGSPPCLAETPPGVVRDGAKLFSPEAVRKADEVLQEVARRDHWGVVVETVPSLDGQTPKDRAIANAEAINLHGLYVLIARDEHKVWAEPSRSAQKVFTKPKLEAITAAFTRAFKEKDYDRGLADAVAEIRKDAEGPSIVGVHDGAKLFSPEAVRKADEELKAFHRDRHWQVAIETIESLDGLPIQARALAGAKERNVHGLYILIAKKEHKVQAEPSHSAEREFPHPKIQAIVGAIMSAFKAGHFDKGLLDAVAEIRKDNPTGDQLAEAKKVPPETKPTQSETKPTPVAPAMPPSPAPPREVAKAEDAPPVGAVPPAPARAGSNLPWLLGAGVGIIFLLWLLSRAFGRSTQAPAANPPYSQPNPPVGSPSAGYGTGPRPGPPGGVPPGYAPAPGYPPQGMPPGYGPAPGYPPATYGTPPAAPPHQGGGFVSGMLGGLGGAVVGNILYDQFGRPHGQAGHPSAPMENYPGGAPPHLPPDVPAPTQPPHESYDPSAGVGGDWGDSSNAPAPPADAAGVGGDWGDSAAGESWNQGAETGGDWGGEAQDAAGTGGDWGGADSAAGGDAGAPDPGTGGDWGGDGGDTGGDGDRGGDW